MRYPKSEHVALSKALSHALRHEPWAYGLKLDGEGWVSLDLLLDALRKKDERWSQLSEDDVRTMLATASKQRHEIKNGNIRAFYGHSFEKTLQRERSMPPEVLYHGTSPEASLLILQEGLLPMQRQHVHLSADRETALLVGRRKASQPVLLLVWARKADEGGIAFYLGKEKVWLGDAVPAEIIVGEEKLEQGTDG